MSRRVEIAGAGFAGMTAAIAFAQRGWSVRLHERSAQPRAFGAGIFVWENGLRVLEAVGALDAAMSRMHEAPHYWVKGPGGGRVGEYVFGPHIGTRMITMTRHTLHEALLSSALRHGVRLQCASRVLGADAAGRLRTERGEVFEADLVVGADGVHSAVRDSLGLLRLRQRVGVGAIRLLIPRTEAERASDEGNAVIYNRAEGERRLLQVPCDVENLYLCFTMSASDERGRALPLNRAGWAQDFPHLASLVARVGDEGRWDEFEMIKLERWSKGRVAVIGDAAHSMTPALGQGAGCAMMNALSLASFVDAADDIEDALRRWEAAERPLTEHTQDYALRATQGKSIDAERGTKWTADAIRTALHVPTGVRRPPAITTGDNACM